MLIEEAYAKNALAASITPTENDSEEWTIQIFPNPTTGLFTINNTQASRVKVINNYGKICAEFPKMTNSTIDIAHLSNGVYFVLIEGEEGVVSRKIVKL